ncbi:hypothetical protein A2U01_0057088, partial [Trifolium medium]|nr:hypothetical protein [Trifolium medium]
VQDLTQSLGDTIKSFPAQLSRLWSLGDGFDLSATNLDLQNCDLFLVARWSLSDSDIIY